METSGSVKKLHRRGSGKDPGKSPHGTHTWVSKKKQKKKPIPRRSPSLQRKDKL